MPSSLLPFPFLLQEVTLKGILPLLAVTRTSDGQVGIGRRDPLTFVDSLISAINKLRKTEEKWQV